MRFASRIELPDPHRGQLARHSRYSQMVSLGAAGATQNRPLIELIATPDARAMPSFRLMAIETRKIAQTTREFDRHDIEGATIMRAAGARIDREAAYRKAGNSDLQNGSPQELRAMLCSKQDPFVAAVDIATAA